MFTSSIIAAVISVAILVGGFFGIKMVLAGPLGKERDSQLKQIGEIDTKLDEIAQYATSYAPATLLVQINEKIGGLAQQLEQEKGELKSIETKLEGAQKAVEEKESHQQATKSASDEELAKLEELLASFADLSSESTGLEQRLAASLKNLDSLMAEATLTQPQKDALRSLSNALTEAGSRLRDLIMQHTQVNERLVMLKQQHSELEDEYTKLVEKQLGE